MEIRKVQMTGGSSYVLSLPKGWIRERNIQKNDPLGVVSQADGTLLITPNLHYDSTSRTKEFGLKDYPDPTTLLRSLIGAYISGFTTIKITSAGRIPPKVRMVVRKFSQMTIGQEVSEEADNSIVLKDILNPTEMPFENTIRRMYVIVKGMHEDAMNALEQGRLDLAEDVIARDTDVDRLHWLVHRQFSLIVDNPSLSLKMGITPGIAATYYQISRIIERVGDHTVLIAEAAATLIEKGVDRTLVAKLTGLSEFSLNIFNKSIQAIYSGSIPGANKIITEVEEMEAAYHGLADSIRKMRVPEAVAVTQITQSLHRITEYSSDIAEILINRMVSQ
ncbi:phosphate uptake regulator, PhoU [Methanocorpusculum labreanum Z]|uniref:Phosphate uptake regulator, PhoU n=1 Tax=Methanocorpusculum labreanum (strain ATCC 43576 / DSM 4855 / Z) TaxID=410358 RepID=A2SSI2_METLZ|nr:phosphate uptake regulator PhoU [Methanocorpusculum labreanum]ABN07288.1 phosphate uptake regulator, PhoU [Methanocorpusculum labreanum Z]